MARTAVTMLQDRIEAIRQEAYPAGYAAAMQAIRDFAANPLLLPYRRGAACVSINRNRAAQVLYRMVAGGGFEPPTFGL